MPGLTSHYSTNGVYLGLGLVFFVSDYIENIKRSKDARIKVICKILVVLFALILTAKRAHILFALMASFAMYYVYNSNKKMSRWIYISAAVLGLLFVFLIGAQFVPALENVLNRFVYADGGEVTNGHIWFWKFALKLFSESPIIGVGWGGFKHEYFKVIGRYGSTSDWVDAHCVFIQLLCEQGIVGLSLFLIATLTGLKNTWKTIKRARTNRIHLDNGVLQRLFVSFGIQCFFLLYCSTGNCLYDCEVFYIYGLALSMAYSLCYLSCSK